MNKLFIIITGTLIIAASGCSSTMTLGPQANEDAVLGATLSPTRVGVTLPLIRATTGTSESTTDKE
jgi:hypothetical protein